MCARCVLRQSAHAPQQSAIAGRDQDLVCELFGESKKEHAVLEIADSWNKLTGGSPADFGCEIDFEHVETELNRRMLSYNRGILKALV